LIMFLNFRANKWTMWFKGSKVIDNDIPLDCERYSLYFLS
jgi:hypothetical protein